MTKGKSQDKYSEKCSHFLQIGDFNPEKFKPMLAQFIHDYNAVSIILEDTCYKSMSNARCFDLIITNSPYSFQSMSTF